MTSLLRPQTLKSFAKTALPLLAALLLASCNNADPYSGQEVSGNILAPSTVNPLDPNSPVTQVALFVNKPVKGLYYVCQDSHSTRAVMKEVSTSTGTSDTLGPIPVVPVARCGNEATSVSFYLGKKETLGEKHALMLGKIGLPLFTPMGSDSKRRYEVKDGKADISASNFLFNYSVADMQSAPERLVVSNSFDNSGQCLLPDQGGKANAACQLVYKAALVRALNIAPATSNQLEIPARANDLMADDDNYYQLNFDYPTYAAFKAAWAPYVDAVCVGTPSSTPPDPGAGCSGLPASITSVTPGLDVPQDITAGAARLRAGDYSLNYSEQLRSYSLYYPNSTQIRDMSLNAGLSIQFMAFPDGRLQAFGMAASQSLSCPGVAPDDVTGLTMCIITQMGDKNYITTNAVGFNYAKMDDKLQLSNVKVESLSGTATVNEYASLSLYGRLFGDFLYDGRTATTLQDGGTDFKVDYPSSDYDFAGKDAEKGSLIGSLFDYVLPDYLSGGDVGMNVNDPQPYPARISQSGGMQTTPLNETVLTTLRDQFYRVQLMRFCYIGEGCTHDIPTQDIGAGANYPESLCTEDGGCDANTTTKPADTNEVGRLNRLGATATAVNLKFVDGAVPGSLVLELWNDDCTLPIKDAQGNPLRLGYVSGTPATSADVPETTADISLLFTSPDNTSIAKVPQLGVTLAGRIDLSGSAWPIYRLGDTNFKDKIRARWTDSFSRRAYEFVKSIGATKVSDMSPEERAKLNSLSAGAVWGQHLNAACAPIP